MFDMMSETTELQEKLHRNTEYFVSEITAAGFDLKATRSAICAVMLYDAVLAKKMADELLDEGIYVVGFSFPVVPRGEARIRVQLSAAHSMEHLNRAIEAFKKVGIKLGVIS